MGCCTNNDASDDGKGSSKCGPPGACLRFRWNWAIDTLTLLSDVPISYLFVLFMQLFTSIALFLVSLNMTTFLLRAMHLDDATANLVFASYGASAAVWGVVGGVVCDYVGYKWVLVFGTFCGTLGMVLVSILTSTASPINYLFLLVPLAIGSTWVRIGISMATYLYVPNDTLRRIMFGVNHGIVNMGGVIASALFESGVTTPFIEKLIRAEDGPSQSALLTAAIPMLISCAVAMFMPDIRTHSPVSESEENEQWEGEVEEEYMRTTSTTMTLQKLEKRSQRSRRRLSDNTLTTMLSSPIFEMPPAETKKSKITTRRRSAPLPSDGTIMLDGELDGISNPAGSTCAARCGSGCKQGGPGILKNPSFWRVSLFVICLVFVNTVYFHVNASFPTIMRRLFGDSAPIGSMTMINMILMTPLGPLSQLVILSWDTLTLLQIGTLVTALAPLLMIAASPVLGGLSLVIIFFVVISIGETLWGPMGTFYITQMAGKKRVGTFLAIIDVVDFVPELVARTAGGFVLATFCPSDVLVPCQNEIFWAIASAMAILTPITLFIFSRTGILKAAPSSTTLGEDGKPLTPYEASKQSIHQRIHTKASPYRYGNTNIVLDDEFEQMDDYDPKKDVPLVAVSLGGASSDSD